MQIYGGDFATQLYWKHTFARMISSKFTAFLQNTFSEEHLWRTASEHLHYNMKQIYVEHIFLFNLLIKSNIYKNKNQYLEKFLCFSYHSVKTIFL